MNEYNPKISQDFLKEIKIQKSEIVDVEGVKIKTCAGVFPPKSTFSHSSEKLHEIFGSLKGLRVLDVGTGTGVQAIHAVKDGAKDVVALDINPLAVLCARENIDLNNASGKITVLQSDLFCSLKPNQKFDVVIANLPITDFPLKGTIESALYDPGYEIHRRFFADVEKYLSDQGFIVMSHINFKGENDFQGFEKMLSDYGFIPETFKEMQDLGYSWRMYRIKKKV